MNNPPMYFGNTMYFITDTGATISIDDFNCLSTDQQEKCKPVYVYYENEKYEINTEFAEVFKEPYGWCIEHNVNTFYTGKDGIGKWTGFSGWDRQWKHKTYKTREIVLEAITQMSKGDGEYVQIKYRIFPVYQGKIEEI